MAIQRNHALKIAGQQLCSETHANVRDLHIGGLQFEGVCRRSFKLTVNGFRMSGKTWTARRLEINDAGSEILFSVREATAVALLVWMHRRALFVACGGDEDCIEWFSGEVLPPEAEDDAALTAVMSGLGPLVPAITWLKEGLQA